MTDVIEKPNLTAVEYRTVEKDGYREEQCDITASEKIRVSYRVYYTDDNQTF